MYLLFSTMKQLANDLNVVAMHCIWRKYRREIKKAISIHIYKSWQSICQPKAVWTRRGPYSGSGKARLSWSEHYRAELMLAQSDSVIDTAEWKADRFSVDPIPLFAAAGSLLPAYTDIWLKILRALGKWLPETKSILFLSTTKRYPFQTSKCARWAIFHMPPKKPNISELTLTELIKTIAIKKVNKKPTWFMILTTVFSRISSCLLKCDYSL